jgi:nucleoside-diphosphate-sugar epimerase
MEVLVVGGTRFFGIHLVNQLLKDGHKVTIATRGKAKDNFGSCVERILLDRTNANSIRVALSEKKFDVVYDEIAYCSNEIKYMLDIINCDKYIYMSSMSIYETLQNNMVEENFDPFKNELIWCDRTEFDYATSKRQAELAIWQVYHDRKAIAVRYPYVIGADDYTKRLLFYVEHTLQGIPMNIDNMNCQMGFIRSDEAGKFLAFLADQEFTGPINGCSEGTISIREILDYLEKKTGKRAMISEQGEEAPYNETPEYSINTEKANHLGFQFSDIKSWIYELLDQLCVQ